MATIKLFVCMLCLAVVGNAQLHGHDLLIFLKQQPQQDLRSRITAIANAEVGVRELSGHNDGKRVEAYLAVTGLKKGNPYCAAFVSWVYARAGFKQPRTAWSPDLFPARRIVENASPGDVIGIYFPEYKRIAHVGLVTTQKGSWVFSTEGNTNIPGSREGDGVYRRVRHLRTIYRIADWVTERREAR